MSNKEKDIRTIVIKDYISDSNLSDATEKVLKWNMEDDQDEKKYKNFKRTPINIIINSDGGALRSGLGFAGFISKSKTPIHTICPTNANSSGFLIFLGGHKRITYYTSFIMYHQLSAWNVGTLDEIDKRTSVLKEWQKKVDDFIISRTKLNQDLLDKVNKKRKDWFFSNQELLKYNIVDEVIGYIDKDVKLKKKKKKKK